MMKSFGTGLSGLQTNQLFIELIGNNLANVNTVGYRADRASFSDLFSQTVRNGSAPQGGLGGINSMQVGGGTTVGSIAKIFSQGNLQNTGRTFDLGISGDGFFRLSDGAQTYYSRAGAFGLDANETLVDLSTGFNVLGVSGSPITIDSDDVIPGQATENLELAGNLPGKVTGPTTEVAESATPFTLGTAATLTGIDPAPLGFDGDIQLEIDGTTFTVTLNSADDLATTVGNLNTAANTAGISGTPFAVSGSGIAITSPTLGESSSITVTDVDAGAAAALGFTSGDNAEGTEDPAEETTELNNLLINTEDYVVGDFIDFTGVDADGTEITGEFEIVAGNETLGDLVNAINTAFPGSTVALDADGNIVMTSDTKGDVALSLSISDRDGNTGQSTWPGLEVTTEGLGPDTVTTSIEIFDENGQSHTVTLDFERADTNLWNLTATIPEADGSVLAGTIAGITFADDGTFQSVSGESTLQFQFNDIGSPQTLSLDFGTSGTFDGLTQFGDSETAFVKSQDGFPPGELVSVFVDVDGTVQGAFSNGRVSEIDQISTATFSNPGGLERAGSNLFTRSANSGEPNSGIPGEGGRGVIRSGVLEVSNVDTSQEFVNLIIAQRGFQVNSRVITTTDTILQELIGIVR